MRYKKKCMREDRRTILFSILIGSHRSEVVYLILTFGVLLFRAQSRHMSSLIDTLNNISLKIPIYVGFTELVVALVGNGLTIMIFRKNPLRSTRTAPCIMILAIMNIIYLTHGLLTRGIAALHNQFDATFGNDILCRFRSFMPYTCVTIIMSLLSLIACDR
jgi:hypothetical protein